MADKDELPEDLPAQNDSPILPEGELPEEKKTQKRFIENGAVDQTPPKKMALLHEPAIPGITKYNISHIGFDIYIVNSRKS